MKRIVFLMFVLLVAAGMVSAQLPQREDFFTVVESVIDFGNIKAANGPVTKSFTVINNANGPMRVWVETSSKYITWNRNDDDRLKLQICTGCFKQGESKELEITLDPKGLSGNFTERISVHRPGIDRSDYFITVAANVK